MTTHILEVPKMMCVECVRAVTRALHAVDPRAVVEADLKNRMLTVGSAVYTSLLEGLKRAGYRARPVLPPLG